MFTNSNCVKDWRPIVDRSASYQELLRVYETMKKHAQDPKNGDDYREHCFQAQLALEKVLPHW